MHPFLLTFSSDKLERHFDRYRANKSFDFERKCFLWLLVVEVVFLCGVVEKKMGLWCGGSLCQIVAMILPNAVCFSLYSWVGRKRLDELRPALLILIKMVYLPICIATARYRNPQPEDHPWEVLDNKNPIVKILVAYVYVPFGALFAPGILGHLVVTLGMPLKFSKQIFLQIIGVAMALYIYTDYVPQMLMTHPLSTAWMVTMAETLNSFSEAILACQNLEADFAVPILYPCQLWWAFLSTFFIGFFCGLLLWVTEVRSREKFLLAVMAQGGGVYENEAIVKESFFLEMRLFLGKWDWVWVVVQFWWALAFALALSWKFWAALFWWLTERGWDGFLKTNESWEMIVPDWRESGVLGKTLI
ncbi:hypothetical protein BSKO_02165 [Bryopsis sp. KO-2023]|nr:hypothetical protein BSKO_02165 [Bryopsis sp. KO-2023]